MVNTGRLYEKCVFDRVSRFCRFADSTFPYLHKKYFSLDRQDYIVVDISIEKFIDEHLFLIIVIECKDYEGYISVSEVEEFHSKLQQIGADNTKGIIVTKNGKFQKSAIKYAKSKGISLARYDQHEFSFDDVCDANMYPADMENENNKKLIAVIAVDIIWSIIESSLYYIKEIIIAVAEAIREKFIYVCDFDKIIMKYIFN